MKSYQDYTIAEITQKHKNEIDQLQAKLSQETGTEVILIAFEEKNTTS